MIVESEILFPTFTVGVTIFGTIVVRVDPSVGKVVGVEPPVVGKVVGVEPPVGKVVGVEPPVVGTDGGITLVMVNDRTTSVALKWVESPIWPAVNVHSPAVSIVTWKPDTVHTLVVDDVNVISKLESDVAVTVKGVAENTRPVGALIVIVCATRAI